MNMKVIFTIMNTTQAVVKVTVVVTLILTVKVVGTVSTKQP